MIEETIKNLLPSTLPVVVGDLPSTNSDVVGLILYDGSFNVEFFVQTDPATIYRPVLKVVVRNQDYEVGRTWVDTIKETLHRHTDADILSCFLVGYPQYLGRDTLKLHNFQLTFQLQLKE